MQFIVGRFELYLREAVWRCYYSQDQLWSWTHHVYPACQSGPTHNFRKYIYSQKSTKPVLRSWVCCKDFMYLYLGFLVFKASKQIKKNCKNWTHLISPHLAHFHYLTAPETVYVYTQQVPSLKCNTGPPSVFLRAGRTAQTLVPYPRSSNCSTLFLMVGVILNAAE